MIQDDPISQFLQQAVREGVFPGAVLFVKVKGQVVYHRAVGQMGEAPYELSLIHI